jgi:hypothetical protein
MSTSLKDVQMGIQLSHLNAEACFIRMEVLLRTRQCWDAVSAATASEDAKTAARLAIMANLGDDLIHLVDPAKAPKELWESLTKQFSGASVARKMALKKAVSSFVMCSSETLEDFLIRAAQLRTELSSANILKDDEFIWQFLSAFE